jgi:hypothetical protein
MNATLAEGAQDATRIFPCRFAPFLAGSASQGTACIIRYLCLVFQNFEHKWEGIYHLMLLYPKNAFIFSEGRPQNSSWHPVLFLPQLFAFKELHGATSSLKKGKDYD